MLIHIIITHKCAWSGQNVSNKVFWEKTLVLWILLLIGFGGYTGHRYTDWCCQFCESMLGCGRSEIRSCNGAYSWWRRFWRFGTRVQARFLFGKMGLFRSLSSRLICVISFGKIWDQWCGAFGWGIFFLFNELWKKKKGYIFGRQKRKDRDWLMRALGL